jgi:hypothetical protein
MESRNFSYSCPRGHHLYELPYDTANESIKTLILSNGERVYCPTCGKFYAVSELKETIPN